MAGGSSNAASVIQGVNRLWNCGLSGAQEHEIAAGLGSDVNFFLVGGPALCRGRGEKVSPRSLPAGRWVLLLNPGFGVPTPWAFKCYGETACKQGQEGGSLVLPDGGTFTLRNDLEPAVFSKYVWLEEAKRWLQGQGEVEDALMSGSGATVFALLREGVAEQVRAELVEKTRAYFGVGVWLEVVELLTASAEEPGEEQK
ncbi:MAG: hypothetical protein HC904_11765 [Blastochloris sp.]|nr:hypothetical protein [Blastochloris sp.]